MGLCRPLGAISRFTAGVFHTEQKQYASNVFEGAFEIVSLAGTINTMNDKFYCHLHISAGNEKGRGVRRSSESSDCQCHLRDGDYIDRRKGGQSI